MPRKTKYYYIADQNRYLRVNADGSREYLLIVWVETSIPNSGRALTRRNN